MRSMPCIEVVMTMLLSTLPRVGAFVFPGATIILNGDLSIARFGPYRIGGDDGGKANQDAFFAA